MADIFNAEVVTLKVAEGAAYGAALQALWCWRTSQGESCRIEDVTDTFVGINRAETATPNPKAAGIYREWQTIQDQLARTLETPFKAHRKFLS